MIEKFAGLEKMTIHQCEALAKEIGFDGATFDICGPRGCRKAKWLDAHFGFFEIEGQQGYVRTEQLAFTQGLWCQNLMPPNDMSLREDIKP